MITMPIPTSESVPPFVNILFVLAASAVFVVIVVQAVRYFRNRGGGTDVFGPPVDDRKPDPDAKDPEQKDTP